MIAIVAIVMLGMVALVVYLMEDRRDLPEIDEIVLILVNNKWKMAYRTHKNSSNRDWVWYSPELDKIIFPEEVEDWAELPEKE